MRYSLVCLAALTHSPNHGNNVNMPKHKEEASFFIYFKPDYVDSQIFYKARNKEPPPHASVPGLQINELILKLNNKAFNYIVC